MRRLPCLMMRDWAGPVYCLSTDTSRFQVSRGFKSRRLQNSILGFRPLALQSVTKAIQGMANGVLSELHNARRPFGLPGAIHRPGCPGDGRSSLSPGGTTVTPID